MTFTSRMIATGFPPRALRPHFAALAAVALLALLPLSLSAQEEARQVDSTMAGGSQLAPTLLVDGTVAGSTGFKVGSTRVGGTTADSARVSLSAPLPPFSPSAFATVGLSYTDYSFNPNPGTPLPENLHGLSADLGLVDRLDDRWTLIGRVSPGFYNAGSGFSGHGFGVGVFAIADYRFSSALRGGIGLGYNSLGHGISRVLPIASLDWKPADRWDISVGFPRTGVTYMLTPDWSVGGVAEFDGGAFYVNHDPAPQLLGKPALNNTRLDYLSVRLGAVTSYDFARGFSVRLGLGAVVLRQADYYQRNYKLKSTGEAAYGSAAVRYRF
jgi:hypothetical protein